MYFFAHRLFRVCCCYNTSLVSSRPFRSSCFLTSGWALDAHIKGWAIAQTAFSEHHTTVREFHLYLPIVSALKTHEWQESFVELPTRLKTREMATFRSVCLSLTRKLYTRIFRKWPSPKRMVSSCS